MYNTESKKEEKIKEFENCFFSGDFNDTGVLYTKCVGNVTELHNYSFDGEDQTIAQGESLSNYFYFDDKHIVYCVYESDSARFLLYDMKTHETERIGEASSELPIIYAVTNNTVYLSRSDESSNSYEIGCLSKADFESGAFDKTTNIK